MLKVGGMWVAPAEVEAMLMEHPAVLEAAVIGKNDGDGLVRPHAFCVLKPGVEAGEAAAEELRAELRAHVKQRLAGYKSPRWIEFVAELPRTATGKVQRFRLRQESSAGPPAS
jgi:benzoate-CoA ligase